MKGYKTFFNVIDESSKKKKEVSDESNKNR